MLQSDFVCLVTAQKALIGYAPLSDEPDWRAVGVFGNPNLIIPQDKKSDPIGWAQKINLLGSGMILVPGTQFDRTGTRLGRGGGWYDRCIRGLHKDWVKVGILRKKQFSDEILKREPWDEPMDWLLIQSGAEWSAHKVL